MVKSVPAGLPSIVKSEHRPLADGEPLKRRVGSLLSRSCSAMKKAEVV